MEKLFSNYSVGEILVFIIMLMLAVKEFVTYLDWVKAKKKSMEETAVKESEEKIAVEKLKRDFEDERNLNKEKFDKMNEMIEKIILSVELLTESDKEDIKSYITDRHHYFVYEQKWIDYYSLNCIKLRAGIYFRENGNSFIEGLMQELETLPKEPPDEIAHKYVKTKGFVDKSHH